MVCKKIHFEEGRPDNNNNINNNYSATYGIVPLLIHYQIYLIVLIMDLTSKLTKNLNPIS
jgi:hypothetical protein